MVRFCSVCNSLAVLIRYSIQARHEKRKPMEELQKRRHDRKNDLSLVEYIILDDKGDYASRGMGRTRNLSEAGLLLETHRSLQVGQDILISLGLKDEIIQARGRVVHTEKPTSDERHCAGIKFVVIGEKDKRVLKKIIEAMRDSVRRTSS
jgi:Tfp pilus assembly protein PilZ